MDGYLDWARKEVELFKTQMSSNENFSDEDLIYNLAGIEAGFEAFKKTHNISETESDYSYYMAQRVYSLLDAEVPLTPLQDSPEDWEEQYDIPTFDDRGHLSDVKVYRHKRKNGLFKYLHKDGSSRITDLDRTVGIPYGRSYEFYSKRVNDIVDEKVPIIFPYQPLSGKYKVITADFKCYPEESKCDWDTQGFLYILTPYKDIITVNKFQKLDPVEDRFLDISVDEFFDRLNQYNSRVPEGEKIKLCRENL